MAIGIRILSDNLSGETTNVTFLPQSGGTISLGTQVFPFNYISDYVYGTYNCFVPTYGYTYSLQVLGPTPTPTVTTTPTNTSTPTNTPTNTGTPTPTPTEPVRYRFSDVCHSEVNGGAVCECNQLATVFGNNPVFSASTAFFSDESGPNTGNPYGYYLVNGVIYELSDGCGIGCTTGATIIGTSICPTPTPTPTNTETPTPTPTITPTTPLTLYYNTTPTCDTINPFENVVMDGDLCSATTITSSTVLPDGTYWIVDTLSGRRDIIASSGTYTFNGGCVGCV